MSCSRSMGSAAFPSFADRFSRSTGTGYLTPLIRAPSLSRRKSIRTANLHTYQADPSVQTSR